MKTSVKSERDNALLKRKEVEVTIIQEASTPSREELRKQLSKDLKAPEERIAVYSIKQPFGKKEAVAEVRVYNTKEDLERIERPYTLARGKPKPKGEGEETAEPKKEEKK